MQAVKRTAKYLFCRYDKQMTGKGD